MTPRRAFWEAFATVAVPSVVIWGFVFCVFARTWEREEQLGLAGICLFFAALPLPLMIPVYKRYLAGVKSRGKVLSPAQHFTFAVLFSLVAVINGIDAIQAHSHGWSVLLRSLVAVVWFSLAVDHTRKWMKTKTTPTQRPG